MTRHKVLIIELRQALESNLSCQVVNMTSSGMLGFEALGYCLNASVSILLWINTGKSLVLPALHAS
jgi:hypothetical protein